MCGLASHSYGSYLPTLSAALQVAGTSSRKKLGKGSVDVEDTGGEWHVQEGGPGEGTLLDAFGYISQSNFISADLEEKGREGRGVEEVKRICD